MVIQGLITSLKPLPSDDDSLLPLHQLSIEGFGVLVKDALLDACPQAGEVIARISVNWQKGKRPVYWLQEVRPVELRPLV